LHCNNFDSYYLILPHFISLHLFSCLLFPSFFSFLFLLLLFHSFLHHLYNKHPQRDLEEALPALAEAVQCLKELKKSDIDEVKSLGRPPVNVVRTLTALCVMFDIRPDVVNDPENPGKKMKDYFKAAGKHLLVNGAKLLEDMMNYDKDNISHHIIQQIEPFYNDPQFTPEIVEKASRACKAMCMWARAMYKYHQVTLTVEPKKILLRNAQV
jgi:dynein heavy chain, axonemal